MLRTRVKAKQKGREEKIYIERRIKESSGGPAELSSRGLGFLQRKFRDMFVCIFRLGLLVHIQRRTKAMQISGEVISAAGC